MNQLNEAMSRVKIKTLPSNVLKALSPSSSHHRALIVLGDLISQSHITKLLITFAVERMNGSLGYEATQAEQLCARPRCTSCVYALSSQDGNTLTEMSDVKPPIFLVRFPIFGFKRSRAPI